MFFVTICGDNPELPAAIFSRADSQKGALRRMFSSSQFSSNSTNGQTPGCKDRICRNCQERIGANRKPRLSRSQAKRLRNSPKRKPSNRQPGSNEGSGTKPQPQRKQKARRKEIKRTDYGKISRTYNDRYPKKKLTIAVVGKEYQKMLEVQVKMYQDRERWCDAILFAVLQITALTESTAQTDCR